MLILTCHTWAGLGNVQKSGRILCVNSAIIVVRVTRADLVRRGKLRWWVLAADMGVECIVIKNSHTSKESLYSMNFGSSVTTTARMSSLPEIPSLPRWEGGVGRKAEEELRELGNSQEEDGEENSDEDYVLIQWVHGGITPFSILSVWVAFEYLSARPSPRLLTSGKKWHRVLMRTTPHGILKRDGRGSHAHLKRVDKEIVEGIVAHIKIFQTVPSHYCRQGNNLKFLPSNLSISEMYRLFLTECEQSNKPAARACTYRHVFCN